MFSKLFHRCPKTGKLIGINQKSWPKWSLILVGFIATIWYLIRVIPKPSRAAYICQQATAPVRIIFMISSIAAMAYSFRKACDHFKKASFFYATMFLSITAFSLLLFMSSTAREATAAFIGMSPTSPNTPIGTARGIYPGRVAWVYNPDAAQWRGNGTWYDAQYNPQSEYDKMIPAAVKSLSGESSESLAWEKIFTHFNIRRGNGDRGYQVGEKITIKINQNNMQSHNSNMQASSNNGNPALILSLCKSLVNAGVPQNMICVSDPSRAMSSGIYSRVWATLPNIVFEDHFGGDGVTKSTYTNNNPMKYSVNNNNNQNIANSFMNAEYLINMPIMKGHDWQGITFAGKNWFGALAISNDYTQNAMDNFNATNGNNEYMAFVDYLGHKDLGEKTIITITDALYPNEFHDATAMPSYSWNMPPFNGGAVSSIIASLDQVANESVTLDFFRTQWPDRGWMEYCDKYIHEAALADNPPSGTFYDPERDGSRLTSLGVHEHWNNSTDKKYSRNLGTGNGIELISINTNSMGPNVSITSPSQNAIIMEQATFKFSVNATSSDASITKVEFYNNGTLISTDNSSPYECDISSLTMNSYALSAKATDSKNSTAESSVDIIVLPNTDDIAFNKTIIASSTDDAINSANKANDNNSTSRWSSAYEDPQWIQIDLGATYKISGVYLNWEEASAKDYSIDLSPDGVNWQSIVNMTFQNNGARKDVLGGLSNNGRFIRMNGTARTSQYGYSLWDFCVYGTIVQQIGSIEFDKSDLYVSEEDGNATLQVKRIGSSDFLATVDYSTSNGSAVDNLDYSQVSGTLIFDVGDTIKEVVVPLINDTIPEDDETIILSLSNVTGGIDLGMKSQSTIIITDEDSKVHLNNYEFRERFFKLSILSSYITTKNISFNLPNTGLFELSVYSMKGSLIKNLTKVGSSGKNQVSLSVPTGFYVLRLTMGSKQIQKRVCIIK